MTEHVHQYSLLERRRTAHPTAIPGWLLRWRDKLSEGRCRMCLRESSVRPLTRHHLIPQWWWYKRGDPWPEYRNIAANIVPLCRPCHDDVERDEAARRMLRRLLGVDEVALVVTTIGQRWLDQTYPR